MLRTIGDCPPEVAPIFKSAATVVAIFERNDEIAGRPYGCTLFVSKMTNVLLAAILVTLLK